ncbi:MAG: iron-siderophore ABC transporter substrate-binding protein [Coriobacteriales bacterium]|jgi:iron complex transport system substrate-binding protein|nr:iron-siderophore ABC transporter substrate-binding protein [Coriobacteriales bacterium]
MNTGKIARVALATILVVVLGLGLLGCATQPTGQEADNGEVSARTADSTLDEAASFPVTIKHIYGETVITSKPERIVTISWSNQDVPLALGVLPVGFSEVTYGAADESRMLPWTKDKVAELGGIAPVIFKDTQGFDFEAISDLSPDLILAAQSGITQEEYDILSEIAPTVAYPGNPWLTSWRDTITLQATAMGMKDEGEQLVRDLETTISDSAAKYPQIKGKTVAFAYIEPTDFSTISIYGVTDSRTAYLADMGLVTSQSVKELFADDPGAFYMDVSAENVDALSDVDIIVSYGDASLLVALQADPLLGSIPAVQRGSVLLVGDTTPLYSGASPSALSIPYVTEDYARQLAEAADKVG